MSPRTKLLVLALFIVLILNLFLYLADIQLGIGRFAFVMIATVLLYALLTRIADKLRQSKFSP